MGLGNAETPLFVAVTRECSQSSGSHRRARRTEQGPGNKGRSGPSHGFAIAMTIWLATHYFPVEKFPPRPNLDNILDADFIVSGFSAKAIQHE
jgi:hypothetical protein